MRLTSCQGCDSIHRDIAGGDDGNDAGLVVTHLTVGLLINDFF